MAIILNDSPAPVGVTLCHSARGNRHVAVFRTSAGPVTATYNMSWRRAKAKIAKRVLTVTQTLAVIRSITETCRGE